MRRVLVSWGAVVSMALGLVPAPGATQPRPRRRAAVTPVLAPASDPQPVALTPSSEPAPSSALIVSSAPTPALFPAAALRPEPTPPATARGYLSLALRGGYGAVLGDGGRDNYLAGRIGGSVGYTFAGLARVSLGIEGIYQTGFSRETPGTTSPTILPAVTRASHGVYAGGTIGIGIGGETVMVRPFALVGALFTSQTCTNCYARPAEQSETYPVLGVGAALHFLTSLVFFGVEGRVMTVLRAASSDPAVALDAVLGVRLR